MWALGIGTGIRYGVTYLKAARSPKRCCATDILPGSGTSSPRYYLQQSIENVLALVGCVYQPRVRPSQRSRALGTVTRVVAISRLERDQRPGITRSSAFLRLTVKCTLEHRQTRSSYCPYRYRLTASLLLAVRSSTVRLEGIRLVL